VKEVEEKKKDGEETEGDSRSLTVHGSRHSKLNVNSSIQHVQDVPANTEKGEEKDKAAHKFRRTKRDEKKPVGVRSPEKSVKKKRGGEELTEMDLDEQAYAKKAKQGSLEEKEVTTVSNEVGLSEQPCGSQ
jgi:hypothetical protein